MRIQIKRVYDPPAKSDGVRVLIDRLWPRGIKKADAAVDVWARDLAPSNELRKWFGHDDALFKEFAKRYRRELADKTEQGEQLIAAAGRGTLTVVYGASNTRSNNAVVFQKWLESLA